MIRRFPWTFLAVPGLVTGCAPAATIGSYGAPPVAQVWLTTPDQTHLLSRQVDIPILSGSSAYPIAIDVDEGTSYQEIIGFGAAMTDASAFLIQTKLGGRRDEILRELFGRDPGLGLSFVRVPMGASDFSMRDYSYDDMPAGQTDPSLAHFTIEADRAEKLPALKTALAINPDLKLVASPWSPPGWMKTTGSLIKGTLRPEYYDSFARYLLKFVDAYAREGVPIFAVTLQNEPAFEPDNYPGMRLDPPARVAVIGKYLGPLLKGSRLHPRILDWDHNWDLPNSPLEVLADSAARKYVDGVAWHCYAGDVNAQEKVHAEHPATDAYFTECSGGGWATVFGDNLKFFVGTLIIGSTRGWAKGVALWNLALDQNDGPHLGGCGNCRGVITINSVTGGVTRNVEYYALAHASEFVRPGAHRIASSTGVNGLQSVAFKNSDDGSKVLIVLNTAQAEVSFAVRSGGKFLSCSLPAGAVATFRWR